jgi:hypothetical protein
VPPVDDVATEIVDPVHTLVLPVIDAGIVLMVATAVLKQPVGNVYVMTAVPAVPPVTTPDDAPTDAIDELLLDQVPPAGALLSAPDVP